MESNNDVSMNEMMNEIEKSMNKIRKGDVVKGKVISVSENEVLVNIGYMTDGIITKNEFSDNDNEDLQEIVQPGDEMDVYVLKVNDGEGNVALSKKMADKVKAIKTIENHFKKNEIFNVTVSKIVKGGAITYIDGIRAFIPASHISYEYVKDLNLFLDKNLEVKVIEFVRNKQKIVLSAKEVEKERVEAKREELWNSLEKGEKRRGIVKRIVKFGAFIDLGGVQGLIHLNDLSWKRVNSASEILSVGDNVEVYVLDFNKEKNRISLGLKDVTEDPWNFVESRYKVGDILEGTVVKLMDFGAFVELKDGIEGLVHVNEMGEERIVNPSDILKVSDKIKVKIMDINKNKRRMALSMKEANNGSQEELNKYNDKEEGVTLGDILKDKLKGFKFEE